MSPVTSKARPSRQVLQTADQIPSYLEWFFASGRSQAGRPVAITSGLWPLLTWCWSLDLEGKEASALCRHLLHEPGYGWREEADVLEAMSRATEQGNPGHLPLTHVSPFLHAVLREGEQVRQRAQNLKISMEFILPRLGEHPVFTGNEIESALRAHGMSEDRISYHREAVHPELQPYLGVWELSLGDRCESSVGGETPGQVAIPISAPACGLRSQAALCLQHHEELAPYFRMSLGEQEFPS